MMRKISLITALITLILFCACSSDPDEPAFTGMSFNIDTKEIDFGPENNKFPLTINSGLDWTSEKSDDWISISPSHGKSGVTSVMIEVTENDSYDSRSGRISFKTADQIYTFDIKQLSKNGLVIGEKEYVVAPEGEVLNIKIVCNGLTSVIPRDSWVEYKESRGMEDRSITLEIKPNDTAPRSTTVAIINGTIEQEIRITQDSKDESYVIEREALVAFYHATNGDKWKDESGVFPVTNENWLSDKPVGEWQHVTVDKDGYVVGLTFAMENLSGHIPPELGNLRHLKSLKLLDNKGLGGCIPPELGNCRELEILNIEGSPITGTIPDELANCIKLKSLLLSLNDLEGRIPTFIGEFKDLIAFVAWGNRLSGEIPSELGNCKELEFLRLDGNNLSGHIPSTLANCKKITHAWLSNNMLDGEFPPEIEKPWRYEVANNHLTGKLPQKLMSDPDIFAANWANFVYQNSFDLTGVEIPGIYFDLKDIDNVRHKSDDYYKTNKLTLLFQWNTMCCVSNGMMPVIESLYEGFHDRGLAILGLTTESEDFIRSQNLGFPNVITGPDNYLGKPGLDPMTWHNVYRLDMIEESTVGELFQYPYFVVPTVTVIDSSGKIVFSDIIDDPYKLEIFISSYLADETK